MMPDCADLEIGLHRHDATHYTVDFRFLHPDSDADVRLLQSTTPPVIEFDLDALRSLELDPQAYGQTLSQALFAPPEVVTAFQQAFASAQTLDAPLRIRFFIGASAPELHQIRWETLQPPGDDASSLLTNENILFSRYLSSTDWRPVQLRPRSELRVLVMIANPSNISEYEPGGIALAPVDVAGELQRIQTALSDVSLTILATTEESNAPATASHLIAHLRDGYDILYLVAHGAIIKSEPYLWLEDDKGAAAVTPGKDLVMQIRELRNRPRLIVFASCQSAGLGSEAFTSDSPLSMIHSSLSTRLVETGVPAVLAMQGNITMQTVEDFMPVFFKELQRDGVIDRAMAVARQTIRSRPDWWMPVLFLRLKSGRIWYVPGFGEDGQDFEKWPALLRNIERGNCTPILGPRLTQAMVENTRQTARHLAETYRFPLAPHQQEELPTVAQYLAISQDTQFPREELLECLRQDILQRHAATLPADAEEMDIADLFIEAWKDASANQEADPYKVLAGLPFSIYITTNFSNLLEEALVQAGKEPKVEICRWNEDLADIPSVYDDDPDFQPDVDHPLIFYLFGHIDEMDSLVVTEDDYFDYLITVSTNRDLIPIVVRQALADTGLLFLGFQLHDWDFRVLYRSLMNQEGRSRRKRYAHVAAQLMPDEDRTLAPERARRYLEEYFEDADIEIFWGSVEDFMTSMLAQQKEAESSGRDRGRERRSRRR